MRPTPAPNCPGPTRLNGPSCLTGRCCRAAALSTAAATLALGLLSGAAPMAMAAELGRLDITAPGAMVSACGGMNWSGSGYATGDKGVWLPGQFSCNAQQTALPNATATQSAAYAMAGSVSTAANGHATMGQTGLYAHFTADNAAGFAQAEATGGWVDLLTLSPANAADIGQLASLSFAVEVHGRLAAQPMGNSLARISVKPYLNDASFAGQQEFTVGGQGQTNFPYSASVDQAATFTTQITLGTPFELGVFARALVGVAGSGGSPGFVFSAATVDFANTITWAGITALTLNGMPVDYTLASASGIDWTQPYAPVPEPTTWALWVAGLLAVAARRARHQRSDDSRA